MERYVIYKSMFLFRNKVCVVIEATDCYEMYCYSYGTLISELFCNISVTMPHYPLLKGSALLMNQLTAMFMKKALYVWRTWYITLIQILMPALFLILTIIIVKTWETIPDLPPLNIDLKVRFKFNYNPYMIKT